jgi:hypothetical protein
VDIDVAQEESQPPRTRRFRPLGEAQETITPMLTPAAAVTLGQEDAFDEQLLADLVTL